jgi:cold shock CspA family protein
MPTGCVKFYKETEGSSFIAPDGEPGQADVYIHSSTLRRTRIEKLEPGMKVKFEIQTYISGGRPRARNIKLIENEATA